MGSSAAMVRRGAGVRRTFTVLCAEALFASTLQASDSPDPDQVRHSVMATLRRLGIAGCAAQLAAEFGDHPECARARMAWALATVHTAFATPLAVVPAPVQRPLALVG
jgi:hypothetical protein